MALNSLKHDPAAELASRSRLGQPTGPVEPLSPRPVSIFPDQNAGLEQSKSGREPPQGFLHSSHPSLFGYSRHHSFPSGPISPIDALASIAIAAGSPLGIPEQTSFYPQKYTPFPATGGPSVAQAAIPEPSRSANLPAITSSPGPEQEPDHETLLISQILLSLHRGAQNDPPARSPLPTQPTRLPHRSSYPPCSDASSSVDEGSAYYNSNPNFSGDRSSHTPILQPAIPAYPPSHSAPSAHTRFDQYPHPDPYRTDTSLPATSRNVHPIPAAEQDWPVHPTEQLQATHSHHPCDLPGKQNTSSRTEYKSATPQLSTISPPQIADSSVVCSQCRREDPEAPGNALWIACTGCSLWFHCPCVSLHSESKVRLVDKFFCNDCKPSWGPTTYLPAPTPLHESPHRLQSDGRAQRPKAKPRVEHDHVKRIKDGSYVCKPDRFSRIPPEKASTLHFERPDAFKEPTVVPAELNRRPILPELDPDIPNPLRDEYEDKLGMIIPNGLTVRRIANLYGPDEKLDVIDVKSQSADRKWTLGQWADYYENSHDQPIRNVISLEVSRSRLANIVRRPQVVRDLDLQDNVWPSNEEASKVQLYCLMSVKDSYTDFHIDFGGSSVYYHIVKGRKTFFFVPPTKSNLQKYEEWNLSPNQNWTWLPDLIGGDCYRLELTAGDTAFIPSGWIHAVWTPEDSIVIGGNFLTRLSYRMQFAISEVEKNTKVPRKFRYPHFQKLHWHTVLHYLKTDPVPDSVVWQLQSGGVFGRPVPVYAEQELSERGPEDCHSRYYSQAEVEGLPDLLAFIFRNVVAHLGNLEGMTADSKAAISKGIPKTKENSNPLATAQRFACWVAWKRGNEQIPEWASSTWTVAKAAIESTDKRVKRISQATMYRLQRSVLVKTEEEGSSPENVEAQPKPRGPDGIKEEPFIKEDPETKAMEAEKSSRLTVSELSRSELPASEKCAEQPNGQKRAHLGPRRFACDTCRKRRIRCRHRDTPAGPALDGGLTDGQAEGPEPMSATAVLTPAEVNTLSPETKRTRNRACATCRITKRRCVHDESGNLSPLKGGEMSRRRASENFGSFAEQLSGPECDGTAGSAGDDVAAMPAPASRRASTGVIETRPKGPVIRISPLKRMSDDRPVPMPLPVSVPEADETDEVKSERLARQLLAEQWNFRRRLRRKL